MRQAVAVGLIALALVGAAATVARGHSTRQLADFSLNPSLTKVTNTHQGELTIDVAGRTAHFKASSGAIWEANYSWTIPSTLSTGKSATASITDTIVSVKPEQSLRDYMNIRGPDFAKQLVVDHPNPSTGTLNVTFPVSAGYATAQELTITIEMISSSVVYHYVRTTAGGGRVTALLAAHQITNDYGKLTLAVSGHFSSSSKLSDCKAENCHLQVAPVGTNYGRQTIQQWGSFHDIAIKFVITSARVDRTSGKLGIRILGRVLSVVENGVVTRESFCGEDVIVYAGTLGPHAPREEIAFSCGSGGAFKHQYLKGYTFKVIGTAITG